MIFPVDAVLPDLLAALATSPTVAVLVAPPGAGKTTRVPLALHNAPWSTGRKIVMLEPRRLAARAAAHFMAESLGETVGETIGYRVRLDTRVGPKTRIEIVTEGVFTRQILDDPELTGIAAVIFDEFHERSLEGDLGLALAIDARALRPDLRLLVMSATLEAARVAALLGGAPIIESRGRAFPVETRYLPLAPGARIEDDMAAAVRLALREQAGSLLAFLPGQSEIARTAERLGPALPPNVDLAPLYGQLDLAAQTRAIAPAPAGRRKIVLATAIAETSLTIEGIGVVIDSGLRRAPAYDPATGLSTLTTGRVSRAGAEQRRGRAGRTGPGFCYRLWHEGQTGALLPFDPPEILGADLSQLVLDLANWGVVDPARLAFLDPPPRPAWEEAKKLLMALGALDKSGRLTDAGRALAQLPLHPRLAHMVAAGEDRGTAAELAALIGERGLGGNAVDLAARLQHFRSERTKRADDARSLARRWGGPPLGGPPRGGPREVVEIGRLLARAYPDRVAQAAGARGRFRLANGRAAALPETEALAGEPFLTITEISGSAGAGRIRAAAALARADLEDLFAADITTEVTLHWDAPAAGVRARRRRLLGALLLADDPIPPPDPLAAATLLAENIAGDLPCGPRISGACWRGQGSSMTVSRSKRATS